MLDGSYLTNPLAFLVQTAFGLYVVVVVVRFFLQLVRADFYNPLSQFVVKLTTPVLRPLRRVIPGLWGLDVASIVLAWALTAVQLALMAWLLGIPVTVTAPLGWVIPELVALVLNVFLFAIIAQALLSWISPGTYNPAAALLYSLTTPVLRPLQCVIPTVSGLDLTPMAAVIGIVLLKMLLLPPLNALTHNPF